MASRPAITRARRRALSADDIADSILELLELRTISTSLTCDDVVRSGALMAGGAGVGAYRFAGGTTALGPGDKVPLAPLVFNELHSEQGTEYPLSSISL
jgi:hypothetical protein